jgi:hypothetical protein
MSDDAEIITVVVGCLDPLLARGILDALRTDRRLRVIVSEFMGPALEDEIRRQAPRLVVFAASTHTICRPAAGDPHRGARPG